MLVFILSFYFDFHLCSLSLSLSLLVLAKQAEKKAQDELSKQKITKSRKRKNTQKPDNAPSSKKPPPPPPAHSVPSSSVSPTLSHAPSTTSLATNETLNGEYIDVVGGGDNEGGVPVPHRHGNHSTPTRKVVKRSGRNVKSNRSKKLKLSVTNTKNLSTSPLNSVPSSPLSSSLFIQQQANGTAPPAPPTSTTATSNVTIHNIVT